MQLEVRQRGPVARESSMQPTPFVMSPWGQRSRAGPQQQQQQQQQQQSSFQQQLSPPPQIDGHSPNFARRPPATEQMRKLHVIHASLSNEHQALQNDHQALQAVLLEVEEKHRKYVKQAEADAVAAAVALEHEKLRAERAERQCSELEERMAQVKLAWTESEAQLTELCTQRQTSYGDSLREATRAARRVASGVGGATLSPTPVVLAPLPVSYEGQQRLVKTPPLPEISPPSASPSPPSAPAADPEVTPHSLGLPPAAPSTVELVAERDDDVDDSEPPIPLESEDEEEEVEEEQEIQGRSRRSSREKPEWASLWSQFSSSSFVPSKAPSVVSTASNNSTPPTSRQRNDRPRRDEHQPAAVSKLGVPLAAGAPSQRNHQYLGKAQA
jgi:hypothetical protein